MVVRLLHGALSVFVSPSFWPSFCRSLPLVAYLLALGVARWAGLPLSCCCVCRPRALLSLRLAFWVMRVVPERACRAVPARRSFRSLPSLLVFLGGVASVGLWGAAGVCKVRCVLAAHWALVAEFAGAAPGVVGCGAAAGPSA